MELQNIKLSDLNPGEGGIIYELKNKGSMRRRLVDLGFAAGSTVHCIGEAPFGDPRAYLIKGTIIALREEDSRDIITKKDRTEGM